MAKTPNRPAPPGMPVYVGFYVPATYHALYGRFFKDPGDILELEREYNDYLVRRLSAIHNLASSVNVSSVRVEAAGFQSYLASKGLDAAQLSEVEALPALLVAGSPPQPVRKIMNRCRALHLRTWRQHPTRAMDSTQPFVERARFMISRASAKVSLNSAAVVCGGVIFSLSR